MTDKHIVTGTSMILGFLIGTLIGTFFFGCTSNTPSRQAEYPSAMDRRVSR